MPWSLAVGLSTHVGMVRMENQDAYAYREIGDDKLSGLLVVCDGMGGHFGGSVASRSTADALLSHFGELPPPEGPARRLESALAYANQVVRMKGRERPELRQMGTTCTALYISPQRAVIGHLGDSRAYRIRAGRIELLTCDHTYVNELVADGLLEPEEAKVHPRRHVITRCIGMADHVRPDMAEFEPRPSDTYLLCSDGLFQLVSDGEMLDLLARHAPQSAAQRLVDLANERGGDDNITVLVLRLETDAAPEIAPPTAPQSLAPRAMWFEPMNLVLAVLVAEVLILGAMLAMVH